MALLENKIILITGSSRGIGRACAVECAKHGAKGLILHYYGDQVTKDEVISLKDSLGQVETITVPGDISDPATSTTLVEEAVKAFGRIDVLVSNVGICPFSEFLTMELSTYHRTRSVNLDGSFYIVQAVARQMSTQPGQKSIIQISSISALVGGEFQTHYTPTKAATLSLMQSCAVALGKYNIRCNAILPGTIATDINKEDLANEEKRKYMEKKACLGRIGVPEDVAKPVVFLASELAGYVTGASLLVDGGMFVNFQ